MIKKKLVTSQQLYLGCDPEFFFKRKGKVIGAEKVLPKEGLKVGGGTVIIDGVQAELNPAPQTCRALLGNNIAVSFIQMKARLARKKGLEYDFSPVVEVEEKEFRSLSDSSKKFGCAPSLNSHASGQVIKIEVDPLKYKKRPAGGHIHLGYVAENDRIHKALLTPERLVPVLDILLGNTAVLIDRDKGNIERRKSYGRAGEYRTPKHGLEYRTLSNFWLHSYPLMSLVTGLARQAVLLVAQSTENEDYVKELISKIKPREIADAINNNDFELAMHNFKAIKPMLLRITPETHTGFFPIDRSNIKEFMHFVRMGRDHWWGKDPIKNWELFYHAIESTPETDGFNAFLKQYVRKDMLKERNNG